MPNTRNGRRAKASFAAIVILSFLTLSGFAYVISDTKDLTKKTEFLAKENAKRIGDIQASRVTSCQQTYRSFQKVFRPFFPPKPWTADQKVRFAKFNHLVNHLVAGCDKQTKPHKNRKRQE